MSGTCGLTTGADWWLSYPDDKVRVPLIPWSVLNLIDSDGVDPANLPVFQSVGNDMLDSIEDLIPGSTKVLGDFLP